jgi:pre-mRNA-splicing factor CDC5/CEF1
MEAYEAAMRRAEEAEGGEFALSGPSGADHLQSAEDIRKLRPGEVDSYPEHRPAKPDSADMDETERTQDPHLIPSLIWLNC